MALLHLYWNLLVTLGIIFWHSCLGWHTNSEKCISQSVSWHIQIIAPHPPAEQNWLATSLPNSQSCLAGFCGNFMISPLSLKCRCVSWVVTLAATVVTFLVVTYLPQVLIFLCGDSHVCVTMAPPPPEKQQRKVVTLEIKCDVLNKVYASWITSHIMHEFDLACSALFSIKKSSAKLTQYGQDYTGAAQKGDRKIVFAPSCCHWPVNFGLAPAAMWC